MRTTPGSGLTTSCTDVSRVSPKDRIYRGVRRGEVRVNKGRIRANYKLCVGDVVRIPPWHTRSSETTATLPQSLITLVNSCLLYEDDDVLVINKPAGVPVHAGSGSPFGIIEALRSARPTDRYMELAHRLDRDTSGCLLIAKKRGSLTLLHALLREGKLRKSYLALVRGKWTGGQRRVDMTLKKNQLKSGERMVTVENGGKSAVTHFTPVGRAPTASLLDVRTDTGRTHQIRVHAQSIDFPLAGDPKYGDKAFNRLCRQHGLRRMFLHAHRISYDRHGDIVTCIAPLGDELIDALVAVGLGECAKSVEVSGLDGGRWRFNERLLDCELSERNVVSDATSNPCTPGARNPSPIPSWERDVIEKLVTAGLIEQRRARRWSIFFKFALMAYLLLILGLYLPWSNVTDGLDGKHTALV